MRCRRKYCWFLQSFLHLDEISTWQDKSNLNPEDVLSRVYGTLKPLNPNLYGGYLVAGLPAVLGSVFYFLNKKQVKTTILSAVFSLITVYAILQTGCRGAYLSMMLIFGCAFLLSAKFFWNTYKKIYLSIIGGAFTLFVMAMTFVGALRHRFMSILQCEMIHLILLGLMYIIRLWKCSRITGCLVLVSAIRISEKYTVFI